MQSSGANNKKRSGASNKHQSNNEQPGQRQKDQPEVQDARDAAEGADKENNNGTPLDAKDAQQQNDQPTG
jgi:hypothetical protein